MMKLHCSLTSPFARKIRVAIRELGIVDQVEECVVDPWSTPADLIDGNPLCKVPALRTAEGTLLPDSQLIMDYLYARLPSATEGEQRWQNARREQLADGLIDAGVAMVIETLKRPAEYRWPDWISRQTAAIDRTMAVLENDADHLGESGRTEIVLGCALAYLDFRFPNLDWRSGRPRLTNWYSAFAERPSMRETQPPAA